MLCGTYASGGQQPCSRIVDRLEAEQLFCRETGEKAFTVIQLREYKFTIIISRSSLDTMGLRLAMLRSWKEPFFQLAYMPFQGHCFKDYAKVPHFGFVQGAQTP